MALIGNLPTPEVGASLKVWLPGETPWADCVAIHDDGSWDGRIANRLLPEMSVDERITHTGGPRSWVENIEDHGFREGQIVRFYRVVNQSVGCELWMTEPAVDGT